MSDIELLFEPLQIGKKLFRNRIVMPPMVVNRGISTAEGQKWYYDRAKGGVSLVIVEATSVTRFDKDLNVDNLKPLVEAIHSGGAFAGIQLFPGTIGQPVTPTNIEYDKIKQLIDNYVLAVKICANAGFDAIEPHGAHGFLLNQFFSPIQNQRTDEFGGTLQNRMRLGLSIVDAIAGIAKENDMLVLYRHTPIGAGYGIGESLIFAEELVKRGVDILDISPASEFSPADRAEPFMKFGVPVIAVNELDDTDRSCFALSNKRASLIAIGRALIADPELPNKIRQGRFEDIIKCTRCNECFNDLRKGIPVSCTQWE